MKKTYDLQDIKKPLKNISFAENQLHSANFNGYNIIIADHSELSTPAIRIFSHIFSAFGIDLCGVI